MESASSWGCELKWRRCNSNQALASQPPREAVSWNDYYTSFSADIKGQPPREAVSWNVSNYLIYPIFHCQPPREAVSWNDWEVEIWVVKMCQPPREAVSWNKNVAISSEVANVSLLVRLWVEILSCSTIIFFRKVSLLVRLWVEMSNFITELIQ